VAEISLNSSLQHLCEELFADLFADLDRVARMPAKTARSPVVVLTLGDRADVKFDRNSSSIDIRLGSD